MSSGNPPSPEKTTPGRREPHTKRTLSPRPYREKSPTLRQKSIKTQAMFLIDSLMYLLSMFAPFSEPSGRPFGGNIAQTGATARGGGCLWRRLRAEAVQGYPLTPKMDAKGHPRPKMEVQGYPKTPKMITNGTHQTSKTTPKVANPTSKSGNASSVSKFEKT